MDMRLAKISVGLALESAITHGAEVKTVLGLYSEPNLEKAHVFHDRLIMSPNHYEREVAIWLEPILEKPPSRADPKALAVEMRKMEFLLYLLINRAGEARQEVNDWMNYIANAAESLTDGFWIDAKILLSQALDISQSISVSRLKSDAKLSHQLDILQRATASYFAEVISYPMRFAIPEARIEPVLRLQEILLDLMQLHYRDEREQRDARVGIAIRQLRTAMQYLMNESRGLDAVHQEIKVASQYLEMHRDDVTGERKRTLIECDKRMKELTATADLQPSNPDRIA